jgi:hypothetical protein
VTTELHHSYAKGNFMRQFGLSLLLASLPIATVAAPTCTQPNSLPEIAQSAWTSTPSSFITNAAVHGTTELIVTLPKDGGHPVSVDVSRSSGYTAIDHAALIDALKTSFTPELRECEAVGGKYFLTVEY